MGYKTEQEEFWAGNFGDDYVDRNNSRFEVAGNVTLFSEIMRKTCNVNSVIEFGSNIGQNLKAIRTIFPNIECTAVEINHKAAEILRNDAFLGKINVCETSILEYDSEKTYDFVLIKGVLIHINPNELDTVYQKLYDASEKYICMAEYYNPTPVTVNYRGNTERLFKRDFAGEFMDRYPDCKLVDYGFRYHRDNNFPLDDVTYFLMEKNR